MGFRQAIHSRVLLELRTGQAFRIFELRDEGRGLYIVQTGKVFADVEEGEYEWAA